MSSSGRRAYQLNSFAAHAGAVNCVRIGRKSSGVLVTGGEDRKVNMWAIGRTTAILSLSGHQSPVECVTFDAAEEVVVAGAAGGTIKMWDLEEAKVVRTLTGHRSNCTAVDFHPYGEFFVSGSSDTNLKIWDVRRKACIHTYRGHSGGITHARFSPDGRWVVSGSQDGYVKLWDLTAGKLLSSFESHDGPITAVEYHPSELLLATCAADRSIRFWDLDTFQLVAACGPEATAVRTAAFMPDGSALMTATSDHLKAWQWEPAAACLDTVDTGWGRVADVALHDGKLLGAALAGSHVATHVVDLSRVGASAARPRTLALGGSGSGGGGAAVIGGSTTVHRTPERERDFLLQRAANYAAAPLGAVIQPPRPAVGGTPPGSAVGRARDRTLLGLAMLGRGMAPRRRYGDAAGMCEGDAGVAVSLEGHDSPKAEFARRLVLAALAADPSGRPRSARASLRAEPEPLPAPLAPVSSPVPLMVSMGVMTGDSLSAAHAGIDLQAMAEAARLAEARAAGAGVPSTRRTSQRQGLQIADFMPNPLDRGGGGDAAAAADNALLADMRAQHGALAGVLAARLTSLQAVRTLWVRGDIRQAVAAMTRAGDAVVVDVLTGLGTRPEGLTLEAAAGVSPLLGPLLAARHEKHVVAALAATDLLLRSFGPLIAAARAGLPPSPGVDLHAEARRERCEACAAALAQLRPRLELLAAGGGTQGARARSVLAAMSDALIN